MRHFIRLLRYALPYRTAIAVSFAGMVLVSFLSAVSIGALQPIFDLLFSLQREPSLSLPPAVKRLLGDRLSLVQALLQAHPVAFVSYLSGALVLLFVIKGFLTYVHEYFMQSVALGVMRDLRDELYRHLHTLSLRFFAKNPTGEVMSRLTSDVDLVGRSVTTFFSQGLKESFMILSFMGLLLLIKWELALLSLLIIPIAAYPIAEFGKRIRSRTRKVQERRGELNHLLQETLSGIRVVKAFGTEGHEVARFSEKNQEIFREDLRIVKVESLSSPLLEVLGSFGVLGMVWLGAYLVIKGVLTPGELMAFLGALASLYQPIRRLSGVNNNIQKGLAGVKRVFEVLDLRPDVAEAPDAVELPRMKEGIAFRDVSFSYDDDGHYVLKGINFSAKLGEIVAIVGSSGVGKTTLVNLIPRFYDPSEGWIEIDGVDIRKATLKSLRDQMGIVTQDTILFDDTVFWNIAYGRRSVTREAVRGAAEAANALEFIERLPQGFGTRIGERGVRLSGGERQRIAIARAILKDPPILILDEATSALDAESERLVQEALEGLIQNRTTFIIAHRLSTIIRADKIIVLEDGRIVEMGTHAELLARRGVYFKLYQNQLQVR